MSIRLFSTTTLLATVLLAGCAGQLDHLGKPPTMSPVSGVKKPIDPGFAGTHPLVNAHPGTAPTLGYPLPPAPGNAYPNAPVSGYPTASIQHPGQPLALQGQPYGTASIQAPTGGIVAGNRVSYPAVAAPPQNPSLWRSGPQSLFGDRRARGIGDILTVEVKIEDEASINNSTNRSRTGSDEVSVPSALGLPSIADTILPGAGTLTPALQTESSQATSGSGTVTRGEDIDLRIAATVVRVLPNGHFLITGNQEVRVNFELRDLQIAGIVRPEDISRRNTITYDKIANARISYGGRGQITDLQQPRIGRQIADIVLPF
ncbi:MAG: flagellar basal body L-ring protein FlgH [Pseudomonadota bacterium]